MKLNKYGLKELTKKQKLAFIKYAIKFFEDKHDDVLCYLFMKWYRKLKNHKPSIERLVTYVLYSFPELAEAIRKKLSSQWGNAEINKDTNHDIKDISWNRLKEGKLTNWDYRLKFMKQFEKKFLS